MSSPLIDEAHRDECALLQELRDRPELLQLVAAARGDELQLQTRLRRDFPDRLVRAAFALCELRRKGAAKFTRAGRMWFDRQGLEQSTAEAVARHKALRFQGCVFDWCCGIGSDAIALAGSAQVTAVDLNPAACLRTRWNADAYDVARRVETLCADVATLVPGEALVHIDPDRRAQSTGRATRVEDYMPGLDFLQNLTETARGGAIKLSPASNFGGKFPQAEVELVSLDGECKEATIWFGELRGEADWRATVLPSRETLAGNPLDYYVEPSELRRFVFDPDPAVVRAGLVDAAAERLGLSRLDRDEEYLTGDRAVDSPFVQPFEVLAELSNNLTEVRRHFRTGGFGQVEIKCRRIPIEADAIRRRLPLNGDRPAVLVFARLQGRARALVCRRPKSTGGPDHNAG